MSDCKIFPGHTTLDLVQDVPTMTDDELHVQPQDFQERIIFMSMYNDIDWTRQGNEEVCMGISSRVSEYSEISVRGASSPETGENDEAPSLTSQMANHGTVQQR